MNAKIKLDDVVVDGVDTQARAATLKQWFLRRGKLHPIRIPILRGVTFHAKPGDRVSIIGMNGSGKSSLLKVISGNYPIHGGTREVEGAIAPLIEMGAGFDVEVSGRRNIKLTYAYRGKLRHYSSRIEQQIIDFAEIGEQIDLPLKTYSSGMMSRLAFASAIFQEPDILMIDEIFAAGDAGFIDKSKKMLTKKVDEVAIALIVHHGSHEMMQLCNRFVLMHEGRIINEGSRDDILCHYRRDILKLSDWMNIH